MADDRWSGAIERMLARIQDTATRVTKGFPHWADPDTGEWTTTPDGDWTGGFWIGMLWLAGTATGEPRYRDWAEPFVERLRVRIDAENHIVLVRGAVPGPNGGLVLIRPTNKRN